MVETEENCPKIEENLGKFEENQGKMKIFDLNLKDFDQKILALCAKPTTIYEILAKFPVENTPNFTKIYVKLEIFTQKKWIIKRKSGKKNFYSLNWDVIEL